MAGTTTRMTAQKQHSLQEIHEKIHYITGTELVSKTEQTIGSVSIWSLVYEKYFFRVGSYTSLAIVLTECGQEQTACVVASGGGSGIVNASFGANRKYAAECVEVLEGCGFRVIESDLDNKGFAERFVK